MSGRCPVFSTGHQNPSNHWGFSMVNNRVSGRCPVLVFSASPRVSGISPVSIGHGNTGQRTGYLDMTYYDDSLPILSTTHTGTASAGRLAVRRNGTLMYVALIVAPVLFPASLKYSDAS